MNIANSTAELPTPGCKCFVCGNDRDFLLPKQLVKDCVEGRVVLFAGAGISTESDAHQGRTFYERIADRIDDADYDMPFPELMELFSDKFGRAELLIEIRRHLQYFDIFPELRRFGTRFHQELATIFLIEDIVTTNWDTYFEDECGALPIVSGPDYAFWNLPDRKVFKLHGSITNIGSIIATADDYKKCYRSLQSGVLGSTLRHMLATKTVIFVGYSLSDPDFRRLYRLFSKEMQNFLPKVYVVTVADSIDPKVLPNATVIQTSGAHFLAQLKAQLVSLEIMLDDRVYDRTYQLLYRANEAHEYVSNKFLQVNTPTSSTHIHIKMVFTMRLSESSRAARPANAPTAIDCTTRSIATRTCWSKRVERDDTSTSHISKGT